ncbi:50S ribosomal protein L1 [Durotheca rogersii]|uniref:50S ribosomal protein L1 n=1 Tax=Durotheca rogersii TaxID=419775 RepID=UPI002220FC9E|nr:50S ribosomal protein L1 [Durotheca rogersii]KAI5857472.1 50S ribosomal protein L1 [Durotheca rogersii]
MAAINQCIASLSRIGLGTASRPVYATVPLFLAPAIIQTRWKGGPSAGTMAMRARQKEKLKAKLKRKQSRFKEYKYAVASHEERFTLCDAMRYLRAAEVGRPPASATYEIAMRVRTPKNSPVLRSRIQLPYPVKSDTRIAVICKEGSGAMQDARAGGAVAFGEETLFQLIKDNPNDLPFNRLICHADSEPALKKAGLGRILGPKGLMPSLKTNTITRSVKTLMQEMAGAENYRERIGSIRMPIGNIQFTPRQLSENIRALVASVKSNMVRLEEKVKKDMIEIALSSSNGPGFPLSGGFNSTDEKVQPAHLSTAM